MNAELAYRVVQQLLDVGVKEICSCAGSRNAPLCMTFNQVPGLKIYNWPEERSAAFFALGRSKLTGLPVPIVVTSGTAAAELLPAAVEAHYSGVPLILLTADRPRNYRNTGAPQAAEQVGMYSHYTKVNIDVADDEQFDLAKWDQRGPCHLNVCFEEPQSQPLVKKDVQFSLKRKQDRHGLIADSSPLNEFLADKQAPFVIVGTLKEQDRENVAKFLRKLNCPIFLEANSGLREYPELQNLRIHFPDKLYPRAVENGYPMDCVIRIGGVPTLRFWRDLEIIKKIPVYSINDVPFPGSTEGEILTTDIGAFFEKWKFSGNSTCKDASLWISAEKELQNDLMELCKSYPLAESSLVNSLSKFIPKGSNIFLGNSLPIREWDLTATLENKNFVIHSNRGCNGIDGQISSALGLSDPGKENWIIVGDLTALYDLAAPWGLRHMPKLNLKIVVINNGGAKIFAKLFPLIELQNCHNLNFEGFAKQWGFNYDRWTDIGKKSITADSTLIEIIPDEIQTNDFNKQLTEITSRAGVVAK